MILYHWGGEASRMVLDDGNNQEDVWIVHL